MLSKYERQIELEEHSVQLGVSKYRKELEKRGQSEVNAGIQLLRHIIEPFSLAIEEFCKDVQAGKPMKNGKMINYIQNFEYDVVAFITAKAIIDEIVLRKGFLSTCLKVASLLEDEVNYVKLKQQNRGLYNYMMEDVKRSTVYYRKRFLLKFAAKNSNVNQDKWNHHDKIRLGGHLIELFKEATGFIIVENEHKSNSVKTPRVIKATPELVGWLARANKDCELLQPTYLPMLVEPIHWKTPYRGGYLSEFNKEIKLVKTGNTEYLKSLEHTDISPVYDAVNALQDTEWRVNTKVLEVMTEVWNLGGGEEYGLPNRDGKELPLCPVCGSTVVYPHECFNENKQAHKDWKARSLKVYDTNNRNKGKITAMSIKLNVANKFKEDTFYFPHTLDWRGRAYPLPVYLNPQADDPGKALLEFANGKELTDEGLYWLKVHTANCFGEDKISFNDRVKWIDDNAETIVDVAANPMEFRFWCDADKPWEFLAACFELDRYWNYGHTKGFESHLPVSTDGSCNGYQHLCALLKDDVGGAKVNLTPGQKPDDLYTDIANAVSETIELVILDNCPLSCAHCDKEQCIDMAMKWRGKVDRKIVKRGTMTVPYGATAYGLTDQIIEEIIKQEGRGHYYFDKDEADIFIPARFLAKVLLHCIYSEVIAAREVMNWFQDCARVAARHNKPVYWESPIGFPVLQQYFKTFTKKINLTLFGFKYHPRLIEISNNINSRKQTQSISPNVVHSFDAAHLMKTVNRCKQKGIKSFSVVHDSYATYASDVPVMNEAIRETFEEVYSENWLEIFHKQLLEQLPDKAREEVPEVPVMGNLDISEVINSPYFFA